MSSLFTTLRMHHPRFIYRGFTYHLLDDERLECTFTFILEPGYTFTPKLTFAVPRRADLPKDIDTLIFHLGLIEMISYWKCACAPEIVIECGTLQDEQIAWWRDLFLHGLGEFYCKNEIDISSPDLVQIHVCGQPFLDVPPQETQGELILVAGGKDSALALELLPPYRHRAVFSLNPQPSAFASAREAGHAEIISAQRTIDPLLLELNKKGYLNGHTPFSAYLAFLGTTIAYLHGYHDVIVANERSAEEGNTLYCGIEVNHQYSKTFRFEKAFRSYAIRYLTPSVEYYSLLRPLHEVQVAGLFARHTRQHPHFRSCNVHQKVGTWCGECPKCAFVYLSLSPFLSLPALKEIFGRDLFFVPKIQQHIEELIGVSGHKPFECVGGYRESSAALAASFDRRQKESNPLPAHLVHHIADEKEALLDDFQRLLHEWNSAHALPREKEEVLRGALKERGFDCTPQGG